jgi:hypothetical protein
MSEILNAAIAYVASTVRWSGDTGAMYMQGTVWYGIMCRSFLLLERILRQSLVEVSAFADSEILAASKSRANGKPLLAMTLGQCVGVLEEVAPALPAKLVDAFPQLRIPLALLPNNDRVSWNRVVSLRNRMAHDGPGFFDTVDLKAGRIWREYKITDPLDQQAKEIWTIGRRLCRSPFVLTCIVLQGSDEELALAKLEAAEATQFILQKVGDQLLRAIEEFHTMGGR